MICILTFCMRSPTGLIIVSPAPRGGDWILPNLNTMPCSNCCTTRTERPAAIMPSTTSIATMIKMASTIANSPSRATRARYGPGRVPNLRHARYRRRCLLIRTTAGGSSGARPQMTCRRGRHGHRLAGCAVARRHRQRGGGSIGNRGAARAAFMAGSDPADDTSRRRVLAPRVSGRSRDRRHRHDRTGTHAGWRSAQREIAPAQRRRRPFPCSVCPPRA